MRIIDSHVHLYPAPVNADPGGWAAARGEALWARLCARRRKDGRAVQGFPDVDGLLRAMDAAGVGRSVLLGWYWERPESCAFQNGFYADCVRRHPDRLSAFLSLHPSSGREATLAAVRSAREQGFSGLGELSPHSQGFGVDDPVWREALALAGEMGLPVNLHVTDPEGRPYPGRVETPPGDFLAMARDFPRTTFVLAHWGGLLPLRFPGAAALANVLYDTAASPLLCDAGIWRRFLRAVRADRVLFGSDFPLNLYPGLDAEPGMERLVAEAKAGLDACDLESVMAGNAETLLA
jgi:predicted TIM-barrel fold metal-dependent hydrolase